MPRMSTKLIKPGISTIKAGITGSPMDLMSAGADFIDWALMQTPDTKLKAARDEIFGENIPLEVLSITERIEAMAKLLCEAMVPPGYDDDDPMKPLPQDVWHVFEEAAREYRSAGGHHKRRILFNAFFVNYFKPEFYEKGMSKILARIATQLEYPEAYYLNQAMTDANATMVQPGDNYDFYAHRLKALGLGRVVVVGSRFRFDVNMPIATKLRKFIWDEDLGKSKPPY